MGWGNWAANVATGGLYNAVQPGSTDRQNVISVGSGGLLTPASSPAAPAPAAPAPDAASTAAPETPEEKQARIERENAAKYEAQLGELKALGNQSPEQAAALEQLKKQSTGELSYSDVMAKRMQDQAMKQQMAMAYARGGGHQAGAIRGAQMAGAEAQGNIAAQAQEAKLKEQSAANALYVQSLQAKQQMAFNAENARQAYLAGNMQQAQEWRKALMQNQTELIGIQAKVQAAQAQAAAQKQAAWISAASTVLGAGLPMLGNIGKTGGGGGGTSSAGAGGGIDTASTDDTGFSDTGGSSSMGETSAMSLYGGRR